MVNFWKKKIKDTNAIANKIGVEEEKIKELVKGKRQIEGKTMEKVLDAINEDKINNAIKNVEILQWYKDTDIKALREKFGYKTQSELAKKLGLNVSVICRIENKKAEEKNKNNSFNIAPNSLKRIYYFFQDDFNKKTDKEIKRKKKSISNITDKEIFKWYKKTDIRALRLQQDMNTKEVANLIGIPMTCLNEIERKKKKNLTNYIVKVYEYYNNEKTNVDILTDVGSNIIDEKESEIWKWYENTDLIELRNSMVMTQRELSNIIGVSQPCIGDVERKKAKSVNKTIKALYNFYIQNNIKKTTNENEEIMKWYNDIEDLREYGRKFGYSKNKLMSTLNLSYDQIRDFEGHKYKSAIPTLKRIYEFYHDENNRQPEIEWTPSDNNKFVSKKEKSTEIELKDIEIKRHNNKTILEELRDIIKVKDLEIEHLRILNEELKVQVKRYEKLIDRL